MTARARIRAVDIKTAARLAQAGCRVTFNPDGSVTVEPAKQDEKPVAQIEEVIL
jgi:hypothetical protein